MFSSCHALAQKLPMPSQLIQHRVQDLIMASKNLQRLVLAASLTSSPTPLPYHCTLGIWPFLCLRISNMLVSQNLAFLFLLHGMAFPRFPCILYFVQVSIQKAPNRKWPFHKLTHYIPTLSSYSLFSILAFLIIEPSVRAITF